MFVSETLKVSETFLGVIIITVKNVLLWLLTYCLAARLCPSVSSAGKDLKAQRVRLSST